LPNSKVKWSAND